MPINTRRSTANILRNAFAPALLFATTAIAQTKDSTAKVVFGGYVDAYYAYYTDSVGDGNFQKFPSVAPRSQQFGLNTAMITAQYDAEKVRGFVALHYGDIARSTWSPTYNAIMEAHVGLRLCKKLWLDAGFFRTHFGTEGLLPKENFTSSVSVCTFMEPYYESGFRLNYNPNAKLAINLYLLNGYNLYEDNNRRKSIGVLATYALGDRGNIGYSNYIGDDTPTGADSVKHTRFHQNLFWNWTVKSLKIQIGGDFCMQKNSSLKGDQKWSSMFAGVASAKYQFTKMFAGYARGEIFNDPEGFMGGVIIDHKGVATGYKLWGITGGVEYKPMDNGYIRLECRQLVADQDQEIFQWDKHITNGRTEFILNLGVSF